MWQESNIDASNNSSNLENCVLLDPGGSHDGVRKENAGRARPDAAANRLRSLDDENRQSLARQRDGRREAVRPGTDDDRIVRRIHPEVLCKVADLSVYWRLLH